MDIFIGIFFEAGKEKKTDGFSRGNKGTGKIGFYPFLQDFFCALGIGMVS